VLAEYRKTLLPAPGDELGLKIVDALRAITHFDKDKEKGPFAFGWGNESLELTVKVKREDKKETLTLEFPE
jgi:hypothetical protein